MARKRVGREEWAQRIEDWQRSGLSAAQYAQDKRLSPRSLTWWRWKLGRDEPGPDFVEVLTREGGSESIEVVLANGVLVRVPPSFDDAALARVFKAAEAM